MKTVWLNYKEENEALIVFFNGWGMDQEAIKHMDPDPYNLFMVYDYSHIEHLTITYEQIKKYKNPILIAWSMGVYAAAQSFDSINFPFKYSIAINGTENPLDNLEGIPVKIFEQTLKYWNPIQEKGFNKRITNGITPLPDLSSRSTDDKKSELDALKTHFQTKELKKIPWNTAMLSEGDLIFTENRQITYWQEKAFIKKINGPHYPFYHWESWNALINKACAE